MNKKLVKKEVVIVNEDMKERQLYMIIDDTIPRRKNYLQSQNFDRFLQALDKIEKGENISLSQRLFYMNRHELEEASIKDDILIIILGIQDYEAIDKRIQNRFTIFRNYYNVNDSPVIKICNTCVTENCPDRDTQALTTCSKHSILNDGYNEAGKLVCEACQWDESYQRYYCSADMPLKSEFCRKNTCHLKSTKVI